MKTEYTEVFKRQITLAEIGEKGQEKLQKTKVLVVGCGGLGSPVAVHLAASGIGELHLIDFDVVSLSNLHRQVFYSLNDVGSLKAETLAAFISARAPFTKVTFSTVAFEKSNALEIIKKYDIVVDGTDRLSVKYLINDACVILGKPLVYGSLYKFDGYVATFNCLQDDGAYSCNLRDAFPVIATDIPTCETAGTMNAIVGTIAMLQVNEVLKIATQTGDLLIDKLLIYNSLRNTNFVLKLKHTQLKSVIGALFNKEDYKNDDCELQNKKLLISAEELKRAFENEDIVVLSVIANAIVSYPFRIDKTCLLKTLSPEKMELELSKKHIVVCQKGNASYSATLRIKECYPMIEVYSLKGGIEGY